MHSLVASLISDKPKADIDIGLAAQIAQISPRQHVQALAADLVDDLPPHGTNGGIVALANHEHSDPGRRDHRLGDVVGAQPGNGGPHGVGQIANTDARRLGGLWRAGLGGQLRKIIAGRGRGGDLFG